MSCFKPPTEYLEFVKLFADVKEVDIVKSVQKITQTGFFGLFDKSNDAAKNMMDIHYLLMKLSMMYLEKVQDACQENGFISKHPSYYICKYQLPCVYDYFICKGVDISGYLIAFKTHLGLIATLSTDEDLHINQTNSYADPSEFTEEEMPAIAKSECEWEILLLNLKSVAAEVCVTENCEIWHVFNESENANEPFIFNSTDCEVEPYVFNENEDPCNV